MKRFNTCIIAVALIASAAVAEASDRNLLGGILGGAIGAAVGHNIAGRNGAIVGAAIGGMTGVAISDADDSVSETRVIERREVVHVQEPRIIERREVIHVEEPRIIERRVVHVEERRPERVIYVSDRHYDHHEHRGRDTRWDHDRW